jgi:mannose-6-phosphate isomerase-like protein (cupin superfamily)
MREVDMTPETGIVVLGPGEGKDTLDVFGGEIVIEADGADTRSAYALLQMSAPGEETPPREAFPPAHVHHQEEEGWFILEGTFVFQVGDRTFEAGAGSFVLAPRGTVHTLWATGPQPHRWLTIFSPSGMEGYFREFAHHLHLYQNASMDEIQALARKYHFEFV